MNMKKKFILLTAFLVGGALLLPCAPVSSEQNDIHITITPMKEAIDLSDLDVRDELNRPVTSPEKKKSLEALFVRGLNELLLMNLTPARRHMLAMAERQWNVLFGLLGRAVKMAGTRLCAWVKETKIKFNFSLVSLSALPLHLLQKDLLKENARNSFQFLISSIISSTCLLR